LFDGKRALMNPRKPHSSTCTYVVWDEDCGEEATLWAEGKARCDDHSKRFCPCGALSVGDVGVYCMDICEKYPRCKEGDDDA
jgi:hypothetical protein